MGDLKTNHVDVIYLNWLRGINKPCHAKTGLTIFVFVLPYEGFDGSSLTKSSMAKTNILNNVLA